MSTLNYIDKNGNINKAGVIPKNYPASNIKMANGESVEDAVKTLTVIDDITPTSAGATKDISFPTGFTRDNSIILTLEINLGNRVFTSGGGLSYLYAMYKSDGTGITLGLTNDAPSGATSKAVKVVLMKIS